MKLKSIRLVGFKSFADETIIDLQDGFTCIVGPNGCGKSNILDALRWVLGEKSARGLRGQQMEDLIFLGSTTRKPAGMTEVEICFDNKDRTLELDYDELLIARRLYISSASEYYINGKRTTRRDLESIFLDTGIGKSTYSILEQGKISEILRSSPEDRRRLLDEAAGIARFKMERQDTLVRLKETEQNLMRLQDIQRTKNKEVESLQGQAAHTREYLHLKEELDKQDRWQRYFEIKKLYVKLEKGEEELNSLFEKRKINISKIEELEKQKILVDKKNKIYLEEIYSLDRNHHRDISSLSALDKRQLRIKKEREERILRIQNIEVRFKEEVKKHEGMEKKLEDVAQLELNIQNDLQETKKQSQAFKNELQNLQNDIKETFHKEENNIILIRKNEKANLLLLEELKGVAHDLLIELEEKRKSLQKHENIRKELKLIIQKTLSLHKDKIQNTLLFLEKNDLKQAIFSLKDIHEEELLKDFERYDSLEEEFRSFFFDPVGLLSRKDILDGKMFILSKENEKCKSEIADFQEKRKKLDSFLEKKKTKKQDLDLLIRDYEVRQENHAESKKNIKSLLSESLERISYFKKERYAQEEYFKGIQLEEKEIIKEYAALEKRTEKQKIQLEELHSKVKDEKKDIESFTEKIRYSRDTSESILPQISKQERLTEQIRVQLKQYEQNLYLDYQIEIKQLEKECFSLSSEEQKEIGKNYRRLQKKIQAIGTFNALAIEELEKSEKELNIIREQKDDIHEARKNILYALKEVDQKSLLIFQESFLVVQEKFQQVYTKLFGGGTAQLMLSDMDNILNSGIDIIVQPPGKKNSNIALLSGGEQTLTAIALIFALYLVKPSPFCFLDEIDAPLDDTNVRRFLEMLTEYTPNTQFLIITHNKITMAYSEAIFGVTQEEVGVSKLISIRLEKGKIQKKTA